MSTDAWTGLRAAGLACGAAALLAACFSERSSGPTNLAGACSVPVTVVDSQHVLVAIANFAFAPDSVRIPAGASVTWLNCESVQTEPHTTTSDASLWDSGEYPGGQRFTHAFPTPGTFPYHCTSHPFMVGKVVVQ